jgi:hypothetical protein
MTDHPSAYARLGLVLRSLRRQGLRGTALLCSAVALSIFCSTGASGASSSRTGAPGTWTLAGSGIRSVSGQIGMARTPDGVLHVVWSRGGAGTPWQLLETTVTPAGQASAPRPIVTGWSRIDDVAAAAFKGRPLSVVFTGTKTDVTGDPTDGLNLATSSGGIWTVGTSAIYKTDLAGSSVPSVGFTRSGTLVQAWSANGEVVVHVGVDPGVPTRRIGKGGNVTLLGWNEAGSVSSERERVLVAWCASGPQAGIHAVEFGADTPSPLRRLRGSETTRCPAASRTAYTRNPEGVDNSSGAASVKSERTVRFWYNAVAQPTEVAAGSGIKQQVATAADPNGRVWVGWRDADSGELRLRRSNGSDTFGAVVSTTIPASQDTLYNLDLSAQGDRVDVIARTTRGSAVSLFHTQAFPGLSVEATGKGGHVVVLVTDAGDPVAGSSVSVDGRLLHTGADGQVAVELPVGSYDVTAAKSKYVGATTRVRVTAAP